MLIGLLQVSDLGVLALHTRKAINIGIGIEAMVDKAKVLTEEVQKAEHKGYGEEYRPMKKTMGIANG